MTEKSPRNLTVLFADICHSTVLFDQLGDQTAVNLVMQVMQLAMRVGINSGEVLKKSNSVYGDTVNIAARLAQLAKAHQSLVSSATIASVSENLRSQLRRVGQVSLQGKAGMIEVHELLTPDSVEEITEVGTAIETTSRSNLMTARYLSRQMRFDPLLVRFLLGRGMECDQVIDHPTVSRQHAEFLYRNGQFILRDFSTNGSVVTLGNKNERLHRSSIVLKGRGKIYLGRTLNQHLFCIHFTCLGSR